jgi:hypothetical protein
VTGAQGPQGPTGVQGPQGTIDTQGSQGPQGSFNTGSNANVNSFGVGTTASGVAGEIRATGDITSGFSDERLKENIILIDNALHKIEQIDGVYYNTNVLAEQYGYKSSERQVGLLAGQVNKVLPEVTPLAPFDTGVNGASKSGRDYLTVKYERLVPLIIEAIKELNRKIK